MGEWLYKIQFNILIGYYMKNIQIGTYNLFSKGKLSDC